MVKYVLLGFLAWELLASLVAFILFGKDKKMSGNGTEVRVKEKTLLEWTAFGGAVGAFVGRLVFRHKTRKLYFTVVILASLVLQICTALWLAYVWGGAEL